MFGLDFFSSILYNAVLKTTVVLGGRQVRSGKWRATSEKGKCTVTIVKESVKRRVQKTRTTAVGCF